MAERQQIMGQAQHHLIAAHQAALRAERDQLDLAASAHVFGPGLLLAGLRTVLARLGTRRATTSRTTGRPVGATVAGPGTGNH